jgi:hypothetical protein
MLVSAVVARRNALTFLINCYGSQTALAKALSHETLTQPILSSIERKRRCLHQNEARDIEKIIGIPDGWMDKDKWVIDGWALICEYRGMNKNQRENVCRLLAFALAR